jgi:hypothetical protein
MLNCPISETGTYIRMRRDTKLQLDNILSTYPFMFTDEIRKNWKEKVQRIEPGLNTEEINLGMRVFIYHIPIEFRTKVNEEYNHRLQKYKQLLGEEKAKPNLLLQYTFQCMNRLKQKLVKKAKALRII